MTRMHWLSIALLVFSCGVEEPAPPDVTVSRSDALYGSLGNAEFAFDAPWRIEPESICVKTLCRSQYEAIPLSIVFRDETSVWGTSVNVVEVEEVGTGLAPTVITLPQFHEIERTVGPWQWTSDWNYHGPRHDLCRRWQGMNCAGFEVLDGLSEWDATLFYSLRQTATPGTLVQLKVTVDLLVSRFDSFGRVVISHSRPSNTLFVRLGHPLPRFDYRWVYGDIHYHSQGTDNEGESGYSHRTTLQAMSALGLDFTFATEHASSSGQFDNVSDTVVPEGRILRDMSQQRWNTLLFALWGAGGANEQVASKPRRREPSVLAVPQLFLGGEVDVVPELGQDDVNFGVFFGNERRYPWGRACYEYPAASELTTLGIDAIQACPNGIDDLLVPARDTQTQALVPGRWFLKDVQGPLSLAFGRQHLLHLPRDQSNNTFVPSYTGTWGGASRRLDSLLREEYAQGHKGVTFLAHPVAYESGSGASRLGPDIVPYSQSQLEDAFRNQSVLGLQVWNEDIHLKSSRSDPANLSPTNLEGEWQTVNAGPQFDSIHDGLADFDRLLLWSIDSRRTSQVSWLAPGQFRKVFLAGGSDAHGDLNYARKGYAFGLNGVSDLSMGKPRNHVMVPTRTGRTLTGGGATTQAVSASDVVAGLSSGQFVVTDGPLARIAIDVNGNGYIDDADVPMGGESTWTDLDPTVRLIVEWKSTPEFGRLTMIDFTVDAITASTGLTTIYNAAQAGVRGADSPLGLAWKTFTGNNGQSFIQLDDRTFLDLSGQLRIVVPNAEGYFGRRVITLDTRRFQTAAFSTVSVPCSTKIDDRSEPGEGDAPVVLCSEYRASTVRAPSALVIRAVGTTQGMGDIDPTTGRLFCVRDVRAIKRGDCESRVVLTNPIWLRGTVSELGTVN